MSLRLNAIIIKDNGVSARGSCRDPSQLAPLISSSCRQRAYTVEMPLVIQCAVPRRVYACTYKTCILPGVILRAPRAHTYVCTYVCVRVFRARKFDARNELSRPEGARGCLAISKRLVSAIRRRKNRKNDRGLIFFSRRFFSF